MLIFVLLFLSGFCGIAYEIIYTKLLGNLLGNQFIVNASVLLTFLLGIGLGTLHAHRFVRFLWAVEAGIGLYAAFASLSYDVVSRMVYYEVPIFAANIYTASATAIVMLIVPAFLIGCSVPLFAAYVSTLRSERAFAVTYGWYNLGAAITVLAIEFAVLRVVGLRAATLGLAALNGLVAVGVLLLVRARSVVPPAPPSSHVFSRRLLAALGLASVASAAFQLLMIKLGEFVLGPYNETFSLVLAVVLLGLAVGSLAAGRLGLSFHGALLLSLAGLVWMLGSLPVVVAVYARLYPGAVISYGLLVLLKFGLVVVLMGLPAVGFGATIPALLRSYRNLARESGQLLFCSSMGNVLGFLLMAFVLHRVLDYGSIMVLITAMAAAALVLHAGLRRWVPVAVALGVVGLALAAQGTLWNERLLYMGHTEFISPKRLAAATREWKVVERFKGPQDVFAITERKGEKYLFLNGYMSIALAGENAAERLVGGLFSALSPRTDEALVLGMGSGATAGAVGLLFDHTDVVEINRVLLDNLYRMREYNFDIESNPKVSIIHDDGIHYINTTPRRYSMILNTVTTPLYFRASKLYTQDFLEMVTRRLTPDGIYVTWLDGRVLDSGFNIIAETLGRVFDECWLAYMSSNYFQFACSNQPIAVASLDAVAANATFREHLAEQYSLPVRLLPYSVVSTDALELGQPGWPANTLDFPTLEYEMARLPTGSFLKQLKERISNRLDLAGLQAELGQHMDWRPEQFAIYADLRLKKRATLRGMIYNGARGQASMTLDDYERAAIALAEEIGTAEAYTRYGERLARVGRAGAATRALARRVERDPSFPEGFCNLGQAYFHAEQYALAIEALEAAWSGSRDPHAPFWRARSYLELGRFDEALGWLETAQQVAADEQGLYEVHFYRGQALEGRGDSAAARASYEAARSIMPDGDRAGTALRALGP